jgi:hypothetical protein
MRLALKVLMSKCIVVKVMQITIRVAYMCAEHHVTALEKSIFPRMVLGRLRVLTDEHVIFRCASFG